MSKKVKLNIQIDIIKEGKSYIAYSPALDIASSGKSVNEAKKSFGEAVELFLESIIERGVYKETLLSLGWQMISKKLVPPTIVARELSLVNMPIFA